MGKIDPNAQAIVMTNFSTAWFEFQQTANYWKLINALETSGIERKQAENMLQAVFTAGWGNQPIFIL
jgi:glycosylphosphatidylinositol transamidase (GPIT) subunit GPI8